MPPTMSTSDWAPDVGHGNHDVSAPNVQTRPVRHSDELPGIRGYIRRVGHDTAWWIGSSEHAISVQIPGAPDEVRDFYVELRNMTLVHPLVVSVTPRERRETADGYTQDYLIRDRIPVGPFTMNTAYTASVQVPLHGDVHTEARQFPHVRMLGTVSFEATGGATKLTERLLITAPRPLASFTFREAVKAHQKMLTGIRQCFEPA